MDKGTFDKYKNNLLRKASDKRREKEGEYFSESDLLANFRKIAGFRESTTTETIMNLGSKSIQSISDMVNHDFHDSHLLDDQFTLDQWDEKFVDAINYLLKLYASVREARGK